MSTSLIIFAAVAVPSVFFMLTWVLTASYRICFPEEPLPFKKDSVAIRHQAAVSGRSVPVGVREIREDQRQHRRRQAEAVYHYAGGDSVGLPLPWKEDLWIRRN